MTRLAYSPRAILDLERLQEFVAGNDPSTTIAAAEAIVSGVSILDIEVQRRFTGAQGLNQACLDTARLLTQVAELNVGQRIPASWVDFRSATTAVITLPFTG